ARTSGDTGEDSGPAHRATRGRLRARTSGDTGRTQGPHIGRHGEIQGPHSGRHGEIQGPHSGRHGEIQGPHSGDTGTQETRGDSGNQGGLRKPGGTQETRGDLDRGKADIQDRTETGHDNTGLGWTRLRGKQTARYWHNRETYKDRHRDKQAGRHTATPTDTQRDRQTGKARGEPNN
ncbi:hypothetical protein ANANG_G00277590, partial [Anguilla anguilla]